MKPTAFSYEKISSESSDDNTLPQVRLLQQHSDSDNGFTFPKKITVRRGFQIMARSPKLITLIAIPFTTMLLTIIFGTVLLKRTYKPSLAQITISTHIPPDYCGNTPAEALAAGCKFEANNFVWQHPLCYDADQEADWRNGTWASDIEFWRGHDEQWNGVGRIPNEDAFSGTIPLVWVNTLQHRRHCLHMWRKYVEAASERRPMDAWTADRGHVNHCMEIIRDFDKSWPDEMVSSRLTLKYPACEYGPVRIELSPNEWTEEQLRLHYP